jgi:hypothetical protein
MKKSLLTRLAKNGNPSFSLLLLALVALGFLFVGCSNPAGSSDPGSSKSNYIDSWADGYLGTWVHNDSKIPLILSNKANSGADIAVIRRDYGEYYILNSSKPGDNSYVFAITEFAAKKVAVMILEDANTLRISGCSFQEWEGYYTKQQQ